MWGLWSGDKPVYHIISSGKELLFSKLVAGVYEVTQLAFTSLHV